jgi:hypothetical protein
MKVPAFEVHLWEQGFTKCTPFKLMSQSSFDLYPSDFFSSLLVDMFWDVLLKSHPFSFYLTLGFMGVKLVKYLKTE